MQLPTRQPAARNTTRARSGRTALVVSTSPRIGPVPRPPLPQRPHPARAVPRCRLPALMQVLASRSRSNNSRVQWWRSCWQLCLTWPAAARSTKVPSGRTVLAANTNHHTGLVPRPWLLPAAAAAARLTNRRCRGSRRARWRACWRPRWAQLGWTGPNTRIPSGLMGQAASTRARTGRAPRRWHPPPPPLPYPVMRGLVTRLRQHQRPVCGPQWWPQPGGWWRAAARLPNRARCKAQSRRAMALAATRH
mmetsp:Transcript_15234/g.37971  ORF Transcript_15234/g.37971 Transcript_15234/m.37971 type:complete len:249 (+) Transcript_15234:327-1073(+)